MSRVAPVAPVAPAAPVASRPIDRPSPTAPTGTQSYGQAWRVFLAQPNAWLFLSMLLVTITARAWVGDFTAWDLVILAAIVAYQPFQEWLIHVYILHWQPRKLGPLTIDFQLAKRHRHHHIDPWDTQAVFTPHGTLWFAVVVHTALWLSLMPTLALSLTTLLGVTLLGFYYEFHHYVIHTTYKPKTAYFKRMTRLHRLHHFKNEHYWYGVTFSQGDALFGTLPEHQRDVPSSPTARDLGGLAAGDCEA